jgi:hypothetical protein
LRTHVTILNKKKTLHYQPKINDIKTNSWKLWSTLNDIWGKKANSAQSFIESDGSFIRKPTDIAIYFNDFSLAILANLGMKCNEQMLALHIQVYLTKL